MKNIKTRNMVITALLTGLTIVIPMLPLRVWIPPAFTATLALHVPIFVAMFISPLSAAFVSLGSALGFAFTGLPPVIAARAATHVVFAVMGAYMIRKMAPFNVGKIVIIGLATAVIHAVFEMVAVIPFVILSPEEGNVAYEAFFVVGVGTLIHHAIDYVITIGVLTALGKAKLIDWRFSQ